MKVIEDINLRDFNAWQGGKDTLNDLTDEQLEKVQEYIEEVYPDGISDEELNDTLWFDRDFIAHDILGFEDYEDMMCTDEERAIRFLSEQYAIDEDIIEEFAEENECDEDKWTLAENFEDWLERYGHDILSVEFPDADEHVIRTYMDGYSIADFDKLELVDGFREYLEDCEEDAAEAN